MTISIYAPTTSSMRVNAWLGGSWTTILEFMHVHSPMTACDNKLEGWATLNAKA